MQLLEELYYGNIRPNARAYAPDSAYMEAVACGRRSSEKLLPTLTDAQRETFEKYVDAQDEASGIARCDAFACGFRLGMRLAMEAAANEDFL